jgi:diguanylate cyclase (GGDEF)-like protein/PAS domain S-box-containing protein
MTADNPVGAYTDEQVDMTASKQVDDLYERIGNSFLTGVYIVQDHVIKMANKSVAAYSGYAKEELIGLTSGNIIHAEDKSQVREAAVDMLSGRRTEPYEYRIVDKRGHIRWLAESVVSVSYRGRPAILGNVLDITEKKEKEGAVAKTVHFDSLTNLPGRRLFYDRLDSALSFAGRHQHKLAVIMMELDRLGDLEETLSPQEGDELLQAATRRLEVIFRKEDTLARLGGDEFIALLPRLDQVNHVFRVAKRIVDAFHLPFIIQDHPLAVYISAGVAIFPNHGSDAESLLRNSDIAMNKAKQAGRNQYALFNAR